LKRLRAEVVALDLKYTETLETCRAETVRANIAESQADLYKRNWQDTEKTCVASEFQTAATLKAWDDLQAIEDSDSPDFQPALERMDNAVRASDAGKLLLGASRAMVKAFDEMTDGHHGITIHIGPGTRSFERAVEARNKLNEAAR